MNRQAPLLRRRVYPPPQYSKYIVQGALEMQLQEFEISTEAFENHFGARVDGF